MEFLEAVVQLIEKNPNIFLIINIIVMGLVLFYIFKVKPGLEAAREIVETQTDPISDAELQLYLKLTDEQVGYRNYSKYLNFVIKAIGRENFRKGHIYWVLECARKNIDVTSIPKKELPSFKESDKPSQVSA